MSKNKILNNFLHEYDLEFPRRRFGKHDYKIDFPYHGGQIRGDVYSCVFGTEITDDDSNPSFVDEIRSAREEDYLEEYQLFLEEFLNVLNEIDAEDITESEKRMLTEYLKTTKPEFYTIEASS